MLRLVTCGLAAFLLGGCPTYKHVFGPTPTGAVVARLELDANGAKRFRWCRVHTGWSANELYNSCGVPLAMVPRAATVRPDISFDNERCVIYGSYAHALAVDSHSAPFYAVCLRKVQRGPNEAWETAGVYGLREYPGEVRPYHQLPK